MHCYKERNIKRKSHHNWQIISKPFTHQHYVKDLSIKLFTQIFFVYFTLGMGEPSRKPILPDGWDDNEDHINDQPESLFSLDDILINSYYSGSEDWDSVFTPSTAETSISSGYTDLSSDLSAYNQTLANQMVSTVQVCIY